MLTARLHTATWQSPEGPKILAYREWGEADNPHVLLCVHGLTRVSADFEFMAQSLSQHCRVVAADMPGRGRSDWLAKGESYAVPTYVMACIGLIAHLKPTTLDWFGTSMGGLIGMGYASLPKGMAPCAVRKLILNDVGPTLNLEALQRIAQYVGKRAEFDTLEQARAAIKAISLPFGPHTTAQWNSLCDTVLVEKNGKWTSHYDPAIGLAFQHITAETVASNQAALWAAYDAITANTLVVRGELSDLLSRPTLDEMSKRGPKAKTVEISGVGHAPTFMQGEQVEIVRSFLF